MKTLIKNCRILSPAVEIANGALLFEDGRIIQVLSDCTALPAAEHVIDGEGLTACPGFIDLHCHGRNNFDFCDADVAGVNLIARGKLAEGVTTLLPTTLTLAEKELSAALDAVARYDRMGCKIPGVHLEGPFINPKCCGAQNPGFVRKPDLAEVMRLNRIFKIAKVSFAIEQPGAVELTAGLLANGIVPSCVHSAATYADFMKGFAAGLRNLSHFCNQMTPLHHRDIGLVGAGLAQNDVFAEFICDKLHICPDMIKLVFKLKGADHIILISDAMRASGMPDGEYSLGGLPVIVAGGAARLKEGGNLAGSTLQLNTAFKNICEVTGMERKELIKAGSYNAARALGWHDLGKLEPGFTADIAMLDDDYNVRMTFVDGELRYRK